MRTQPNVLVTPNCHQFTPQKKIRLLETNVFGQSKLEKNVQKVVHKLDNKVKHQMIFVYLTVTK